MPVVHETVVSTGGPPMMPPVHGTCEGAPHSPNVSARARTRTPVNRLHVTKDHGSNPSGDTIPPGVEPPTYGQWAEDPGVARPAFVPRVSRVLLALVAALLSARRPVINSEHDLPWNPRLSEQNTFAAVRAWVYAAVRSWVRSPCFVVRQHRQCHCGVPRHKLWPS
eukprot:2269540-Prymnesium_polylepis.3